MTTFPELGLRSELLRALDDVHYTVPTPVQSEAIPVVLDGKDLLACAQTGTGKTAGFLLPILHELAYATGPRLRALVLSPTRELAAQLGKSALKYGKYLQLRSTVVFGGVGLGPQIDQLERGVDLLIATPGRLLDHMQRGNLSFHALSAVVLDEADRMLDMGFLPDVRRILNALPAERQTLLFSATMPADIERLAHDVMQSPVVIDVGPRATPVSSVRQVLYLVEAEQKGRLLHYLLQRGQLRHVLVFTRTKSRADWLARRLSQTGRQVEALHGDKSQRLRTRALDGFRTGQIDVLVATDVAARGLDVQGISHVINFDVPQVADDYIHRIGRTARAEAQGDAISLACLDELSYVRAIERSLDAAIPRKMVRGFEPGPLTVRQYTQPQASRAARLATGAIRHFAPRGQKRW